MKSASERSYGWLLWSLAITGALLDQATKYGVFRWLYNGGEYEVVPGVFKLITQFTKEHEPSDRLLGQLRTVGGNLLPKVNQGALFGFWNEHKDIANAFFATVSVIAAIAIIYWSRRQSTTRDPGLCAALGLILAGTLGNLFDRLVFGGVRDFLYFYWINWPVFNVADCCLVVGAALLLTQAFWSRPPAVEHVADPAATAPEMAAVK